MLLLSAHDECCSVTVIEWRILSAFLFLTGIPGLKLKLNSSLLLDLGSVQSTKSCLPSPVLHASVSRLNGPRSAGSFVMFTDLIGGQKASGRPHHYCARSAHHKNGEQRTEIASLGMIDMDYLSIALCGFFCLAFAAARNIACLQKEGAVLTWAVNRVLNPRNIQTLLHGSFGVQVIFTFFG